jgi:hypothetical protein
LLFIVETDLKNDKLLFSIPDLGIKSSEGKIPDHIAKKHPELKDGELWVCNYISVSTSVRQRKRICRAN